MRLAILLIAMLALHGCSPGGTITYEQQRAKKDALQKIADDHKNPKREVRPQ